MKDRSLPKEVLNNILLLTAMENQANPVKEVNPFEGVAENVELVFEPLIEFSSCGNTTQRSRTNYKTVDIIHEVTYSWNILKKPIDKFDVCLILPMDAKLENGGYMVNYYEPEGFGCPSFNTLKDALSFIDNFGHFC